MRLLSVIDSLGRAGAEQALVNLLPALQSHGYECEVAVLWPPYDLAPALEERGITVHYLNLSHRWSIAAGTGRLAHLIRNRQFHLVHGHVFFASIYVALSKWLAPRGTRVVTFHGIDYDFQPAKTVHHRIRKSLHGWLMRNGIQGHSAVSTIAARHFELNLKLSQVRVIPNGIPLNGLRRCESQELGINQLATKSDAHPFTFIVPARLMPEKGHCYLVEAVDLLRTRSLSPRVLFYGDGPCRESIVQDIAKRNLQTQVVLCGEVPHAELMRHLQAADAFVLSSTHEGFGLAIAEAMALGLPVLVSDAGGTADLVKDAVTGLVVPPGNPEALANGMARLIQDSELRARLAKDGQRWVESHFSVECIATQWDLFYQELVGQELAGVV